MARLSSGETLLASSVAASLRVHGNCTVVLDSTDTALAESLTAQGVQIVTVASRDAGRGMGDSLAAGMGALGDADACIISLADMPWILDATRRAVAGALQDHGLVVPAWEGQWGHPVGFQRRFFPALASLTGDRGARSLLHQHETECLILPVTDRGVVRDVDTPADLR